MVWEHGRWGHALGISCPFGGKGRQGIHYLPETVSVISGTGIAARPFQNPGASCSRVLSQQEQTKPGDMCGEWVKDRENRDTSSSPVRRNTP